MYNERYISQGQLNYIRPGMIVIDEHIDYGDPGNYDDYDWKISWKGEITTRCHRRSTNRSKIFTRTHTSMPKGMTSKLFNKLLSKL